ncbi:hypothetical protein F5Y19DRAFT_486337 [Xylariaceae sp. FL1651]|nr:hypothetical protein F5Y19DRAFT_486337 [Xylariaceae sp. FL1651]
MAVIIAVKTTEKLPEQAAKATEKLPEESAVNLQYVEEHYLEDPDPAMFKVLKATLQYPGLTKVKAAKLANDINFICEAEDRSDGFKGPTIYLWTLVIGIASCIPPDHSWQDCLVQAVGILRQREDIVPGTKFSRWKELPDLSMAMRELWLDPASGSNEPDAELLEELVKNHFFRWKNQNSFAARLTGSSFAFFLFLPTCQLRVALEEPPMKGPIQECRLWVACEWIIHCTEYIYKEFSKNLEPKHDTAFRAAFRTGSICGDDVPILGVKRWEFWKKRLDEVAANAVDLKLDNAVAERVSDTIRLMETVQKKAQEKTQEKSQENAQEKAQEKSA